MHYFCNKCRCVYEKVEMPHKCNVISKEARIKEIEDYIKELKKLIKEIKNEP